MRLTGRANDEAAAAPSRRPDCRTAMTDLIASIRATLPFADPRVCTGECAGCTLKLLDYLDGELSNWEARLAAGERVGLAELSQLARSAAKVHRVLVRNGVLAGDAGGGGVRGRTATASAPLTR